SRAPRCSGWASPSCSPAAPTRSRRRRCCPAPGPARRRCPSCTGGDREGACTVSENERLREDLRISVAAPARRREMCGPGVDMTNAARHIFQNGERLTAQRLNDAVDFCLVSLRRALLAPLSAGVAIGLEMRREQAAAAYVPVSAGVAIDGLGRILVLREELR